MCAANLIPRQVLADRYSMVIYLKIELTEQLVGAKSLAEIFLCVSSFNSLVFL